MQKHSFIYCCRWIKSWNLYYISSYIFSDLLSHLFLPGCTLFFYETDGRSGIDHNSIHKHAVWVENSIVQAVPEHPKKDFVFCLSNALGDAFLFQVSLKNLKRLILMWFQLLLKFWIIQASIWSPWWGRNRIVPLQYSWSTVSFKTAEWYF